MDVFEVANMVEERREVQGQNEEGGRNLESCR